MLDHVDLKEVERNSILSKYGGWRWPPLDIRHLIILPDAFYPQNFFIGNNSCEGFENNDTVYKFSNSGYYITWRWKLLDGQWLIEKSKGGKNLNNTTIGISRTCHASHHFKPIPVNHFSFEALLRRPFS
jgi:hypothetical protein